MTLLPRPSESCQGRASGEIRKVVITVAADAFSRLEEMAEEMASIGLEVTSVMSDTGVVTGVTCVSRIPELRNINGVESVDELAS